MIDARLTNTNNCLGLLSKYVIHVDKWKPDKNIIDTYKECFGCKLLPLCKGGCVDRFLKRGRRACYMKTIDGYNYAFFPKSVIDEAFKMMYVLSRSKG